MAAQPGQWPIDGGPGIGEPQDGDRGFGTIQTGRHLSGHIGRRKAAGDAHIHHRSGLGKVGCQIGAPGGRGVLDPFPGSEIGGHAAGQQPMNPGFATGRRTLQRQTPTGSRSAEHHPTARLSQRVVDSAPQRLQARQEVGIQQARAPGIAAEQLAIGIGQQVQGLDRRHPIQPGRVGMIHFGHAHGDLRAFRGSLKDDPKNAIHHFLLDVQVVTALAALGFDIDVADLLHLGEYRQGSVVLIG